ncbi:MULTISPECIES: hypothetical protein [unclassified Streptomyces]|uniref:hypothetical protein n=1 Tax=unclassified Streptomyces TaxID=2593676 RepID=UPI00364E4B47
MGKGVRTDRGAEGHQSHQSHQSHLGDRSHQDHRRAEIDDGVDAIARAMLAELTGWPDMGPFVRGLCAAPDAGQQLREGASQ